MENLRASIPILLDYIKENQSYFEVNNRLYNIYIGGITNELKRTYNEELKDIVALEETLKRITPINILPRVINKLSTIYSDIPERQLESPINQELYDLYKDSLNDTMNIANKLLNLNKCVAVEPFIYDEQINFRAIPAHLFIMYSDDIVNPNQPTVYIKLMGKENKKNIYFAYSTTEFIAFDNDGKLRKDIMERHLNPDGINPLGVLPVCYIRRDTMELLPKPGIDDLEFCLRFAQLFTDINYAHRFSAFSFIYTTNASKLPDEVRFLPSMLIELQGQSENSNPTIGTVKPDCDVANTITLAFNQFMMFMDSHGLKASTSNMSMKSDSLSGISKIIDEADSVSDRKIQQSIFLKSEKQIYNITLLMHNLYTEQLTEKRKFNETDKLLINFSEIKPFKSDMDIINEIKMKLDLKLMTKKDALKQLYPNYSDLQIEQMLMELSEEEEEEEEEEPEASEVSEAPEAPEEPEEDTE